MIYAGAVTSEGRNKFVFVIESAFFYRYIFCMLLVELQVPCRQGSAVLVRYEIRPEPDAPIRADTIKLVLSGLEDHGPSYQVCIRAALFFSYEDNP